jgi:tRNA threonylcarbamoyl adenosine modification protein YeaZ
MSDQNLILGVESAVAGGSLSLLRDQTELATWHGDAEPLRAEDFVIRIQDLLSTADVKRSDLTGVAASAGPGSFTGIRAGLATAMGMARSLNITFSSFSVLEAIASAHDLTGAAAIPMGRGSAAVQHFENGRALDEPFNVSVDDVFALPQKMFLVHPVLAPLAPDGICHVAIFDESLATALARRSLQHPSLAGPPIFLSRTTDQ